MTGRVTEITEPVDPAATKTLAKPWDRILNGRLRALRAPLYRRYWLGSFASVGATQLLIMGQAWLIFELTNSALYLGYLGAATSIPNIIISLFGGSMADRFDKRRVLVITSAVVAGLLALLCLLDYSEVVQPWHVLVISGAISLVTGLDWPARMALFPLLVNRDDMMSAVALNTVVWQTTRMVIPALGGVIIALADTWVVFFLGALGFFAMHLVLVFLNVHTPGQKTDGTLRHVAEGFRFILNDQLIFMLILLTFASMFFGWSFMQIMPAFADLLGSGETGYGALVSSTGFGSITGTIIVGSLQTSPRLGQIMLGALGLMAVFLGGFSLVTANAALLPLPLSFGMGFAFLISMTSSVFLITSMTVIQLSVPENLRGRVMGIHSISYSLMSLGGLAIGALASYLSPPLAVAIGAGLVVIFIVAIGLTQPTVRSIDGRELAQGG